MSKAKKPIEGTRLWLIGKDVPVVDMEKDSIFSSNVSWLMQEALGCSGRAEGQFEYCDDRNIVQDCCRQLNLSPDDLSVARLIRDDIRHLKAVGIAGKRSVMMACLVALYRDEGRHTMNHKAFWKALQDYQLEKAWERLMATVEEEEDAWKAYNSKFSGYNNGYGSYKDYGDSYGNGKIAGCPEVLTTPWEGHGVIVNVVCDSVPVIDLQPHSIFHGNASWLLQAATGSCSKADGLFEYYQDRDVMAACSQKLRLTKDEISIARLKSRPDLIAAGTTGKRSVMLALCLLLAWDDKNASNMLEADIQESDKSLKEPLADVLVAMHQRIKVSKDRSWMGGRQESRGGSHGSDYYSGGYDYPSRGREASSRRSSYRQASPSRSPRRKVRKEKRPRTLPPDTATLDEQLKEYMTHNSNRTRD